AAGAMRPVRGAAMSSAIEGLLGRVAAYLTASEVDLVRRAYAFAAEAHDGQTRLSGEPYISHPLVAARTLAELRLDAASIAAALLHDVAGGVGVPISEIEARFGPEVARLVDGVTGLSKCRRPRRECEAARAADRRRMFRAMADDGRVGLIKLADRLHNMQT